MYKDRAAEDGECCCLKPILNDPRWTMQLVFPTTVIRIPVLCLGIEKKREREREADRAGCSSAFKNPEGAFSSNMTYLYLSLHGIG